MRARLVLAVVLLLCRAAVAQDMISVHNHLMGKQGPISDFDGAADAATQMMDKNGYRMFVVMPPPQPPDAMMSFDCDDFAQAVRKRPARFAFLGGGGTLNPMIQKVAAKDVTDAVRKQFETRAKAILSQGAAGFGEMSVLHLSHADWHPYEYAPADHPLFLLLADLAAQGDVVIDVHMDVVAKEMPLPAKFKRSSKNPDTLPPNLAAFERLLDHNPKAKVILDHVGRDETGDGTVDLYRALLTKHKSLYMSIATSPDCIEEHAVTDASGEVRPEWLALLKDFPDRFMIGCDVFPCSPKLNLPISRRPSDPDLQGPGLLLKKLPDDLAKKVSHENAERLFKLKK